MKRPGRGVSPNGARGRFDNITSSVTTFGNCEVVLWANRNHTGDKAAFTTTAWAGGTMNDRAGSYRMKAIGESIR